MSTSRDEDAESLLHVSNRLVRPALLEQDRS